MAMTLGNIRQFIRGCNLAGYNSALCDEMIACIDAHLTQPAQAVDVGAVADALENEYLAVANGEKKPGKLALEPLVRAVQTIRALAGEQAGWLDIERKASPEHQTDMLMARMVLNEVIVPPSPTSPRTRISDERRTDCNRGMRHAHADRLVLGSHDAQQRGTPAMNDALKVFHCDDSDLFAAKSAEQAASLYEEMTGDKPEEGYPCELTDAELDAPQPEFDENEQRTGGTTSIRQMLAEHGNEPGWLAGSEW